MKTWSVICLLFALVSSPAFAVNERSYGSFELLGKPWFIVSMSDASSSGVSLRDGFRLEFKVVEEEIAPRRFQSLWLDALTSSGANVNLQAHSEDLQVFFDAIRGPLLEGDYLALEAQGDTTVMTINHYEHARLDGDFLSMFVASLTDRIAPVPVLRNGLLNEIPSDDRQSLERRFMQQDVSLSRVSQTARWLRYDHGGARLSSL